MSTADELLREAQYAFQCISFGESAGNSRNRRRASSLSRKIIRKYPGTMEASEAHALLRRLGEESYTSNIKARHRHIAESEHHAPRLSRPEVRESNAVVEARTFVTDSDFDEESVNWVGLIAWIAKLPKFLFGLIAIGGIFLFGIFGPLLFIPLVALLLFTGPFRSMMNRSKQRDLNETIRRFNAFIADQEGSSHT